MTLLVATKTAILVDSIESVGSLESSIGSAKIRVHPIFKDRFFVAGEVQDLMLAWANHKTAEDMLNSEFPCSSHHSTVALWVHDMEVWVLECAKGARWCRLSQSSDIAYMAGAGWHWFEALVADGRDIHTAFKRVCDIHSLCSLPAFELDVKTGNIKEI